MSQIDRSGGPDGAPPTNKSLLVVAGILLAIPIVALLWVFICAGLTYAAHRLVLAARKPRPGSDGPGSDRTKNGEGDR